jgi:hypothetical protein
MRFFAAPLGHKVTALLLAIAVAGGLHTWFRHKAVESSSAAELSFDADAARRISPAAASANQPAVTLAQSMLSDEVVQGLSKQAYLAAADMPGRVSEFRSRLELTQPSAQVLDVRFRDPDPDKSTETANSVANALSAWAPPATPTPVATPAPAPAPRPVAAPAVPAPAPVKKPAPVHHDEAGARLAAALGELEGQLTSTSRSADGAGSGSTHYGGHPYGGYGRSSYAQSEEQQALKSGVRAALKKVDDLRGEYATGDAGHATKEHLGAIREALSSVLSVGGGRYRAGVSASQLREERAQLTRAIDVVAKQRQSIARDLAAAAKPESDAAEQAAAAPAPVAPAPAPVASAPASTPSPDATAAPAAAPAPSPSDGAAPESSIVGPSSPGPLRLLRLAGSPAPTLWWPSALAGLVCGLLYWSVAAWPSRAEDDAGYEEEATHSTARFITPDQPVRLAYAPPPPPPIPASPPSVAGDEVFDRAVYKRASFSYEPPPPERYFSAVTPIIVAEQAVEEEVAAKSAEKPEIEGIASAVSPEQIEPAPMPAQPDPAPVAEERDPAPVSQDFTAETREPVAADPAPVHANIEPAPTGENLDPIPMRENIEAAPASQKVAAAPARENVVEMADPWAELMKKALSETEIGRRFDGPSSRSEAGGKDKEQHPNRPDRLAG